MEHTYTDYSYGARPAMGARRESHGATSSPISSKRSMHWPFSGSISTHNSPIDASEEQTPVFPTHSSILRRYASTRSAALLHRHTPSSVSRNGTGSASAGTRGLRHGANPSISTMRTVASSSTLFPVPDYVANYIRGETPETVAQRREERARLGTQRFPDIREGSMDIEDGMEGDIVNRNKEMDANALPRNDTNGWTRRFLPHGWRATMSFTLFLAVLMAIAAAVTTGIVGTKHSDTFWTSESPILTGDSCKAIRDANRGAHGAAAALGVLLLAGAGHAAQVLSAPTRNNVDKAHGNGKQVDIGRGLSIRNFTVVNIGRVLISLVAVVAATGALVVLNALLFTTATVESSSAKLDDSDLSECSLTLDGTLLGVTLIFLVLTAGSLIIALARPTFKPLLTIGDAIASFARHPDTTLRYSTGSIAEDFTGRNTPSGQALVGGQELRRTRWVSTVSITRWVFWAVTWIVPFGLALASLILSIARTDESPRLTFGQPHWTTEASAGFSRSALVILVSLPQIIVAILYLSTSALLTAFFSARELGGYDAAARAAADEGGVVRLRVSSAGEGMQTTSSYATLPPIVSIILWGVFTAIGFFVSQSLTLVALDGPDKEKVTGVGLTPLALVALTAILAAMGVGILLVALLCQSAVPQHIDGSRTIAALCQSWGASSEVEEMREQPSRQYPAEPLHSSSQGTSQGTRRRTTSWSAMSEAPGTIASGQWMAAGR